MRTNDARLHLHQRAVVALVTGMAICLIGIGYSAQSGAAPSQDSTTTSVETTAPVSVGLTTEPTIPTTPRTTEPPPSTAPVTFGRTTEPPPTTAFPEPTIGMLPTVTGPFTTPPVQHRPARPNFTG